MTDLMPSKTPISGLVASILNERELVINIGSDVGVKEKMYFKVLSKKPFEIFDPENHKPLGQIDREKVRVIVVEVNNTFSICRTYKKNYVGGSSIYAAISASALSIPQEVVETLRVDDSSKIPPLSEEESYVKIGDRVIQTNTED